ncbi:Avr9/Cf-9 rapidly elicited protein [Salix suchowensis]|nr:Avr9/Cf-9 rapidly elicited protein [Salix suchowensis]
MNSMFSSFDAFCAELLGEKLRSSFPIATNDCNTKRKSGEGSSSRSSAGKQEKKVPRFAPEFDGLNCFETIVNY